MILDLEQLLGMSTVVGKTYLATAELKTMSGTKVGIANKMERHLLIQVVCLIELTSTGSFSYTFTATNTNTGLVFKILMQIQDKVLV